MNVLEARSCHFIGIGGAGMCPLAEILAIEGRDVSGSDLVESEATEHLRSRGVRIHVGHHAGHLGRPEAVVYSAAVRADNPEMAAARGAGIPVFRRAELLGALMRRKRSVAVSGAHGKTTTTAMIGAILVAAGLDPTIIVGGRFRGGGSNLRWGRGTVLVAEADEYDRAFHALASAVAVVTNIDLEHLDTYRDMDDLQAAFVRFAGLGDPAGAVVAGIDSEPVRAIVPRLARRCVTFATGVPARVGARDIAIEHDATRFELMLDGSPSLTIALRVPGAHNVRNAIAAVAAAREVGVPVEVAAAALADFQGIARRFEVKGERDGVLLVDDYAHHPTEISATLDAARSLYPARRLVVIFQPHLYSRTRDLASEMGRALLGAHVALVAPIYPARERPIPGVTSALIADAAAAAGHPSARALIADAEVLPALAAELRRGDVLMTVGAGDVARFGDVIPPPRG